MSTLKHAHILLVDDDAALKELFTIVLQGSGHTVETAADGRQATAALRTSMPDLIVLDMMMPLMDGLTFLRWLRQERGAKTPVLCLTGMEKPGSEQTMLDAGATSVIYKPANTQHLLTEVSQLVA